MTCTCYVDNRRGRSTGGREGFGAVVDCPKHSTPGLRDLWERAREDRLGRAPCHPINAAIVRVLAKRAATGG